MSKRLAKGERSVEETKDILDDSMFYQLDHDRKMMGSRFNLQEDEIAEFHQDNSLHIGSHQGRITTRLSVHDNSSIPSHRELMDSIVKEEQSLDKMKQA